MENNNCFLYVDFVDSYVDLIIGSWFFNRVENDFYVYKIVFGIFLFF